MVFRPIWGRVVELNLIYILQKRALRSIDNLRALNSLQNGLMEQLCVYFQIFFLLNNITKKLKNSER